ncbi:hypothetical protein L916_10168 [Phytophthora nicotianae]|uniref:ZSWIM1/3 RNaseH-like domain-containing protein n=1 Tax=Phytophthora nicotianae TaxID=4792 RepID=W2IXH2_PHYNI|nr:hypothetical protein L916_10168 [Phytophthora nicotianae]
MANTPLPMAYLHQRLQVGRFRRDRCNMAGKNKSRGDRERTGHNSRSTGCGANFFATALKSPITRTWRICVTTHNRVHNHRIRRDVFDNYPSTRRVSDPNVLDWWMGPCRQALNSRNSQVFSRHDSKRVILRDVPNLVQRLKAKHRGSGTVEKRLEAVLRKFCSYQGNRASIFVDESETTQTITMQTRQMKRFLEAFPDVVMVDSTHETKFKLFSFMINNIFGHGQYVQHSLVENKSHACMKDAISAFKENNPTWDKIRAIMTDKDFDELSLLQHEFPLDQVLIIHFHLKNIYALRWQSQSMVGVLQRTWIAWKTQSI